MRRLLISFVAACAAAGCGVTNGGLFGSGNTGTAGTGAGGSGGSSSTNSGGSGTGGDGTGGHMTSTSSASGSSSHSSASSSSSSSSSSGSTIGCSDGTREAYKDMGAQPKIAGCSGGFDVPGVTTPESMAPTCNRMSGNDSANPQGTGCSVEDLCAEGWHVCVDAPEVASTSATGQCDPVADATPVFWLTRQVQDPSGNCIPPPATNNLTGCGNMGGMPINPGSCNPLDHRMRQQDCAPTQNWYCGQTMQDGAIEAQIVVKIGSGEGGVLCCKDP